LIKIPSHKKQSSKSLKKKRKDKQRYQRIRREKDAAATLEKQMHAQLGFIEKFVDNIPKTCAYCDMEFDNKSDSHLDSWKMEFGDGGLALTCNECQENKNV
jgi:hypothetical protein